MKLLVENYEFGKEVLLQNIDINYSNSSYSNEKKKIIICYGILLYSK
jgi:hypothetical protein